jgi:hypothetical protein
MLISHFSNSQCNFRLKREAICNIKGEDVKGLFVDSSKKTSHHKKNHEFFINLNGPLLLFLFDYFA